MFCNSAWKEEYSSDKRKVFETEVSEELGCRTPKRFTLGKAVKDG